MKQIVLIEDNPSDRWIIKMALDEEGIKATIRELVDGEQALHYAQKACAGSSQPAVDLILLDLNLPRYNGQELLKTFRDCFHSVPILVISSADPSREQPKLAPYTNHYFRKPHGLEEFLKIGKKVASLLDGQAPTNRFHEASS